MNRRKIMIVLGTVLVLAILGSVIYQNSLLPVEKKWEREYEVSDKKYYTTIIMMPITHSNGKTTYTTYVPIITHHYIVVLSGYGEVNSYSLYNEVKVGDMVKVVEYEQGWYSWRDYIRARFQCMIVDGEVS